MKPGPLWTCLLAVLLPVAAAAEAGPGVLVRVGSHDGYGRVTFALPPRAEYHLTQQDQHVAIEFDGNLKIGAANAIPRNVVGITGGTGRATLDIAAGTVLHEWRYGDLLVIDVLDPGQRADANPSPTTAAAKSDAAKPPTANPDPGKPPAANREAAKSDPSRSGSQPPDAAANTTRPAQPPATTTDATPPKQEVQTAAQGVPSGVPSGDRTNSAAPTAAAAPLAPAGPVPATPAPASTAQSEATTQSDSGTDGELDIQADAQLGLAAFRLRNVALIVLDQPRTIDTTTLRDDPVFGSAAVQALPTATVIKVPLDAGTALAISRGEHTWRIVAVSQAPQLRPIQAEVADQRLLLQAATPGAVVGVLDPETDATLLVGTQRSVGQGVLVQHRSPEFTLLPSWQGVALEPRRDSVTLRPVAQGFGISGVDTLSPATEISEQLAHSAGLTREFDFPSQPTETLLQALQRQQFEAATAPTLARGPRRDLLARTMISLGLSLDAGSVLRVAATDDPHLAGSPEAQGLASIAALLAHRPEDAGGIADPTLPQADDIVFWRAVRLAELQPGSPEAAAMLAATAPLALSYPPEMRDRLLPLVAETLAAGGEAAAADALLAARPADASLDLARAMLAEAKGDKSAALADYDRLALSHDQSVHARAGARAVELRLASGAINAQQAADQLQRLLYAWRGDAQERDLRERLAELEARAGDLRTALGLLRETETLFPDDKAAIHAKLGEMFAALLRGDALATLPPLDLVSLVEDNADLLPAGQDGEALQARLADRLLELDLPKRAGPMLEKLIQAANSAPTRAGFGARLAALRLREDDPAGVLAALDASAAPGLPDELIQRRTLLAAQANARRGDNNAALAALDALDGAAADEARATILERANDWPAAEKALTSYVARTVPPSGKLDDTQRRTLLRLATAAARAGDEAALTALRERETPRMDTGPLADMFRLLTAAQVRSVADLKRSGQEAALARGLAGELKALQPGTGVTR
jgi:hypothetical protein